MTLIMLRFEQCRQIRKAGMCIRQITNAARYRKLSAQELLNLEVQLRRIEAWLNTAPGQCERWVFRWHRLKRRLKNIFRRKRHVEQRSK